MANKTIKYSYNWNNKLDNVVYIDIRKRNAYFEHSQHYDVFLQYQNNAVPPEKFFKLHHTAQLLHKKVRLGKDITELEMWLTTGWSAAETVQILCRMHKISVTDFYESEWDINYWKRLGVKSTDL